MVVIKRNIGLGDALMITLAGRAWKARGEEVALVTQSTYAPLLSHCPDVDRVMTEVPTGGYTRFYDLCVGSKLQFDFAPGHREKERIDLILELCDIPPQSLIPKDPWLEFSHVEQEVAAALWESWGWGNREFVIALAPYSESVPRSLTFAGAEQWFRLVRREFPHAKILWVGDRTEEGRFPEGQVLVGAPLTLVALILERCNALLTVDSGLMHLGAAVHLPTLAFFSEEAPETRIGYYPSVSSLIRPRACPWGRYPCGSKGGACFLTPCISQMPPEMIWAAFQSLDLYTAYQNRSTQIRVGEPPPIRREEVNPLLYDEYSNRKFYSTREETEIEISFDRTRLKNYEFPRVYWVLKRIRGGRVLDVGPAGGQISAAMMKPIPERTIVDACEPHPVWAKTVQERINGRVYNHFLEELLTQPGLWDTVVLSDVLEHLIRPHRALAQMVTNWKPSRIVATTPLGHWDTDQHLWEWQRNEFEEIARALEGKVEIIHDSQGKERWLGMVIDRPLYRERP